MGGGVGVGGGGNPGWEVGSLWEEGKERTGSRISKVGNRMK